MTNCRRTDDYEYSCTNVMARNYRRSSKRLTTFTTFKNAHDFHDFRLLRFLDTARADTIKKWGKNTPKNHSKYEKWG